MKPFLGWWAGAFIIYGVTLAWFIVTGDDEPSSADLVVALVGGLMTATLTATFIWGVFY